MMAARVNKGMYGLSGSGMDVDDMVKKMMMAQQTRYDKMYKSKVKTEWQKTTYNNFYKSLTTFQFDTLPEYKLQANMSAKAAKMSDETIASAKAHADAVEMEHQIEVTSLASNAYLQSAQPITRMDDTGAVVPGSGSIKLKDLIGTPMPVAPPVPEEPDPATATPSEIAQYQIDKANFDNNLWPRYQGELNKTAFTFQIGDGKDSKVLNYTYRDLVEGTMYDLADSITGLGLNLQASYDKANDSFNIFNKTGGESNKISIGVYTGGLNDENDNPIPGLTNPADIERTKTLFNNLHLASFNGTDNTLNPELQMGAGVTTVPDVKGVSATAIIDGRLHKSESNKISAGGVTYTLNKIGTARTTVSADTETVVKNVKKFVEDYNKMIDSLNDVIHQKTYRDYEPLTDEEKSAMSKEQIEKWEEKARSGILSRDSILNEIVNNMRSALSQPIDGIGKYNSAANIGITSSSDYLDYGKLEIDETKLRAALAEDPECAYKVFGADADDVSGKGVANRLTAVAKSGTEKIVRKAGMDATSEDQSTLGVQIASIQEKMKTFQKQMDAYQERLYKQFNAMESAIASLNSQYNFVTNFTSGG